MATDIDTEILGELAFSKLRPDVSIEKYKENYFVFDVANTSGIGETPAYEKFQDFYRSPSKPARFKSRKQLKKQLKIQGNTIVQSDNVEYTLTDNKGTQKIVVLVKVIDLDPDYANQEHMDKSTTLAQAYPTINTSYYIEKSTLHPIDVDREDPPQQKIVIDPIRGKKKKPQAWFKQPSGTILETDDSIYVILETSKDSWKDHEEQQTVFEETKSIAVNVFITNYKLPRSRKDDILKKATDAGRYIANRPKAKCKMIISIPRQVLKVSDMEITIPPNAVTMEGLTFKDFKSHLQTVYRYLTVIEPVVKKENIALNMRKIASDLVSTGLTVVLLLRDNPTYPAQDDENIKITFGDVYPVAQVEIFPKPGQAGVSPMDPPASQQDLDEAAKPIILKLNKAFLSNPLFKNKRSVYYLMNLDYMAKDISSFNSQTSKWYEFLRKYTHDMPEYKPAASAAQKSLSKTQHVQNEIEILQSNFTAGMTHAAKEAALREIGPGLKAAVGDIQRTMFEKIEDPTLKMIFQNIEQINSLDSLYELVLNKIPVDKLLGMASSALTSKVPNQDFLESALDGPNNLPTLDFSAKDISNAVLNKLPAVPGMNSALTGISEKLEEGLSFDFSMPGDKIFDVTEGKTEEAYGAVRELITSTVTQTIKTILKIIKNGLFTESEEEKNKKIGSFEIQNSIAPDSFSAIQSALNTLKSAFFESEDVIGILKIISSLATPLEILAIFEGRGDAEVIDIIGTDIMIHYPQLANILQTLYQKEDFLMLIGKNILDEITTAIGDEQINSHKEFPLEIDFCDTEDAEGVIDHLIGRFPDDFLEEQTKSRQEANEELISLIQGIEKALSSGDIEDFLFGNKIKDILNSVAANSRSSQAIVDMVVKGYFEPIEAIYSIESLQPGDAFLESRSVPDPQSNRPLDHGIQIEINKLRSDGDEDDAKKLEKEAKSKQTKIVQQLSPAITDLKESLKNNPCKSAPDANSYTIGTGTETLHLSFSNFLKEGLIDEPDVAYVEFKDAASTIHPPFGALYLTGTVAGKEAFTTAQQMDLSSGLMQKKGLLDVDDYNIPPSKAGFISYVKEIFEDKLDFGFWGDQTISPAELEQSLNDIKKYIFNWSVQTLINRLSDDASSSPFFEIPNLKKLKFSATEGDQRVPPLACDEENTEEGAKTQTNQDDLIEEIILLEDIEERFKERKSFFSSLEKERNELIFNRTDMENAILMETTESFFKVLALEFLISGIFVYSEVSVKSLLNDKSNFTLMQDVLAFTMQRLGDNFRNNFSEYLKEYITLKQEMGEDDLFTGGLDSVAHREELAAINTNDLNEIVNWIFREQVFTIYGAYQKAVQLVSNKQTLEVNEFLDIIPNLDIADSSMTFDDDNRFADNPKLAHIVSKGGFILERYIKADYGAPPVKQVAALDDFVINRKNIIKVPTFELGGGLKWVTGGDEAALDLNLVNTFLQQQSEIIHDAATANPYAQEYQAYIKSYNNFHGSVQSARPADEIFEIMNGQYAASGEEFLQTLPGFEAYKKALEDVSYSIDDPNAIFAHPNYTGKVSLKGFSELQDFIKNDINKDLTETLESTIETYEELVSASSVLATYEEQLTEYQAVWGEKYNIMIKHLDGYIEKFVDPVVFELPNPGGFPDPMPFSDDFIFEWHEEEQELKKKYDNNKALYAAFDSKTEKLITEIVDILLTRMKLHKEELNIKIQTDNLAAIQGYPALSEEEKSTMVILAQTLQQRINYLTQPSLYTAFESLQLESEKIKEKEQDKDFLLEGYIYDTDIESFFISSIKAADEIQQKAYADYEKLAVTGPYKQYFKSLRYGIRLSYVYPSTVEDSFFNSELPNILERMDKICGKPSENCLTKSYKIKEVSLNKDLNQDLSMVDAIKNFKIYSIPLIEQEQEIDSYFKIPPPVPNENNPGNDKGDKNNKYIPLTYPIVENFPLKELKDAMLESDDYKMLMSEMYNYGALTTAVGLYTSLPVIRNLFQGRSLGIFSGTKISLRDVFQSALENRDFTYLDSQPTTTDMMKKNFLSLSNPTDDPSKEIGTPEESFGYAAAFAKTTGLTILKYFVETTDPAIIRGKQIQKAIIGATQAATTLAESGLETVGENTDTSDQTEQVASGLEGITDAAANDGMLLPIVMLGVRPMPPIPFPIGDPSAPITPAGLTYLALTAAGGLDSFLSSGETAQDVVEKENPDKKCDDK